MTIFRKIFTLSVLCCLLWGASVTAYGAAKPPVYVDPNGVLRDTKSKKELAFFGVNYTVPFAYGYRAVNYTGDQHEKIIDQDVYHISRMGVNAFRLHVWDTEISDTIGNLLENEHLRLFDYMVAKFKERGIKVMITPIAFWGNGYPERDMPTPGFSYKYGKGNATRDEGAIKAQENYLKQFITHKNAYTGLTYLEDPDIILLEINNEPSHGNAEQTVGYIKRMVALVRSTGWDKPLLYNISQNSSMAETFLEADIEGITFQWYPSGLVHNSQQMGNFLPHVDKYLIPFKDNALFGKKMKATYEFDAADVMLPFIYPAVARSFREAGFQWTTQFAYDPINTAFANTEYQTHYLNLAYTPNKAISLLIAAHVYLNTPRNKNWGSYPADSLFGPYRISYSEQLCELNAPETYYYSAGTQTKPVSPSLLKKVAGVGNSPVVAYFGSGAFFLDKLEDGIWRLEVFPDVVPVRDPFERASLTKEVTRIEWGEHPMAVHLPDLGKSFTITGLNSGNFAQTNTTNDSFLIKPGAWLLVRKGKERNKYTAQTPFENIRIGEFYAPLTKNSEQVIRHTALPEVTQGIPFVVKAYISGVAPDDVATVSLSKMYGSRDRLSVAMVEQRAGYFEAIIPAQILTPGVLQYSISIRKRPPEGTETRGTGGVASRNQGNNTFTNTGLTGNDSEPDQIWTTRVVPNTAPLYLYDAQADFALLNTVTIASGSAISYTISGQSGKLVAQLSAESPDTLRPMGWQMYVGDKCEGRKGSLSSLPYLVVRARSASGQGSLQVTLINQDGAAFGTQVSLTERFIDHRILIDQLLPDRMLLLPRPYPGFLPLWFSTGTIVPDIRTLERIQVLLSGKGSPIQAEIESIRLESATN